MALNQIGDQIRSQLANFFATESGPPVPKQGRSDKSQSSEAAKRPISDTTMPFDKPQAAWLQHALGDTFSTFGKHVDDRFDAVEK